MKSTEHTSHHHSYRTLAFELIVDFAIMYLVMYTMIDTISHFHFNLNTLYMTLMMISPMAIVMLLLLLALFSGNMGAQATQLLTQADWLPYTPQLWDSSFLIDEGSITGHLLFASVGYQANPTVLQVGVYLAAVLLVTASPLFRNAWFSAVEKSA